MELFIIDNFLDKKTLDDIKTDISKIKTWNNPNSGFKERQIGLNQKSQYEKHENYSQNTIMTENRYVASREELGQNILNLIDFFDKKVINLVKEKTKIQDLFLDKNMRGGGLQRTKKGGFLKMHLDNNWNPILNACPVVNTILFLSEKWNESYKGQLQIKDKIIDPIYNRLIIRTNSEDSYHGFTEPLNGPEEFNRDVLVLFYYSKSTIPEVKRTSALWL